MSEETERDAILLVLPVPLRDSPDGLRVEKQARNGLDRWAENFQRVVVACPVEPERPPTATARRWNRSR